MEHPAETHTTVERSNHSIHPCNEKVAIDLIGAPRVTAPDGKDLTPRGMSKRAILALIALAPNRTVNRRWLEAMLWPESDSVRASASLRQNLTGLRRAFSDQYPILLSDRLDVFLDKSRVCVDVLDKPSSAFNQIRAGRELLEGIDLPSENFEDWLRQERSSLMAQAEKDPLPTGRSLVDELAGPPLARIAKPLLIAETNEGQSAIETFVAETVVGQLGQTSTEMIHLDFQFGEYGFEPLVSSPSSVCYIRVQEMKNRTYLIGRLTDRNTNRLLWHRRISIDAEEESIFNAAASLAVEITEVFASNDKSASEAQIANSLAIAALEDVFSFDPIRLTSAQDKLCKSNEIDPHAPRPALLALAKAFAALEDPSIDESDLQEIVRPLVEESRRLDANNPVALAFLADVYDHVFDDPATAMSLAKCAIRANPGFGYAFAGLSAMELLNGKVEDALNSAQRAFSQLQNTSLEVLALMRLCVASMNAGQEDVALNAAQRAADLAPFSCPPLRHLYALKLAGGDQVGAGNALKRLRKIEPDFSMERLRMDPSYPGSSIRRMGYEKLKDTEH